MKNNFLPEVSISLALILLLMFFLNPFGFWMPNMVLIMLVILLIVVFAVFCVFIWKELARDEREVIHLMLASRVSYLIGAGVLVIGIIVQALEHKLDPWLVLTLVAMVVAKILGLVYNKIKN